MYEEGERTGTSSGVRTRAPPTGGDRHRPEPLPSPPAPPPGTCGAHECPCSRLFIALAEPLCPTEEGSGSVAHPPSLSGRMSWPWQLSCAGPKGCLGGGCQGGHCRTDLAGGRMRGSMSAFPGGPVWPTPTHAQARPCPLRCPRGHQEHFAFPRQAQASPHQGHPPFRLGHGLLLT